MKIPAAMFSLAVLSGCAGMQPPVDAGPTPTCASQGECEFKWGLARRFVLDHAGFKLQTYSQDFMETYNPTDYSPQLGAQVSKDPLGAGRFEIRAKFYCANMFGCTPPAPDTLRDFNATLNSATYSP